MDIKELVSKMTLEEKAGLCSGADFWHTKAVPRLGVPSMMVSDGPHGLRKQDLQADHLGINESIKAVCFPAGCAAAASFDRNLLYKVGETLGNECQAEGVGVILGPAVNIKRSPLCGRNFEYYSEDPYLASELAANEIEGVQSKNVGTSLKHFFANNQEHRRMSSSSEMDERTAREIYLAAFEGAVKQAKPWTVMCSYNRINGVYAAQNRKSLTDILRKEWGFDGFVVSDWGAVNDRVPDLEAGLDLEMPTSFGLNDEKIVQAVQNGTLKESVLDRAVERILTQVQRFEQHRDKTAVFDREKDHALARKAAGECMVLLKNDAELLPLSKTAKLAFIGEFAAKPRYQGGGSSHINSSRVDSAWGLVQENCGEYPNISYAQGYDTNTDQISADLQEQAVQAAKEADTAVIFAGLPDTYESEGYDRTHMRLPENQAALIEAVTAANPHTVVVLHNGSPVEMPWLDRVQAVLEAYLGGQAVGGAQLDVLFGAVNPSGHLAETFPKKLEDNPSYLYYLGEGDKTEYREGVFVGYRYYDTKKMDVLFPFGHGLSYTAFSCDSMRLDKDHMRDTDTLTVQVQVTNTGKRTGKEVLQLYVAPPKGEVIRPIHELKGFEKVELAPGETKTVTFTLQKRAFAYYDMDLSDWRVESGTYTIELGESSRKILKTAQIAVTGTSKKLRKVTLDTTFGDLMQIPGAAEILQPLVQAYGVTSDDSGDSTALGESTAQMMEQMLRYMPLRGMVAFGGGKVNYADAQAVAEQINRLPALQD